ncbi:MAG: hypothetical protein K2J32_09010 [Ruminococcus sp.]|nr:hypothetical protein [Ruminococcus sp.]
MTHEEISEMMLEMGLPSAYEHFSENENPSLPFLIWWLDGENTFSADNYMYYSSLQLNISLYTDEKSLETEAEIERILKHHHIFYNKSEDWIESEKLYEILYEMEV